MLKRLTKIAIVLGLVAIVGVNFFHNDSVPSVTANSAFLNTTFNSLDREPLALKVSPETRSDGVIEAIVINKDLSEGIKFQVFTPGIIQHDPEWVNTQTLLLNGNTLYSPVTKETTILNIPSSLIFGYALDPSKTKLAVIVKSKDQNSLEAWILELKSGVSSKIASFPFQGPIREVFANIGWISDDKLIFDGDLSGKPALFSYTISTKDLKIFKENAMIPFVSPDGKLIIAVQTNNYIPNLSSPSYTSIALSQTGELVHSFKSPMSLISWGKDHSHFVGIEPGKITGFSFVDKKINSDKEKYFEGMGLFPSLNTDGKLRFVQIELKGNKIEKSTPQLIE